MSCPLATRARSRCFGGGAGEDVLEGLLLGGVVAQVVVPAPDDICLGTSEDPNGMWVVVSSGDGAFVEFGRPGAGVAVARVAGEVAQGVSELVLGSQRKVTFLTLPDWRVEGGRPARQLVSLLAVSQSASTWVVSHPRKLRLILDSRSSDRGDDPVGTQGCTGTSGTTSKRMVHQ